MTGELTGWLDNVATRACAYRATTFSSFQIAMDVIRYGIPGDFVECGVFAGSQCAAMARAIMESRTEYGKRKVHLFDGFKGVPPCGPEDTSLISAGAKPYESCCPMEAVQGHMLQWGISPDLLVYHPGWFADTMPVNDVGPIALLRLDGDLYESTKVCLQHLWPKVVKDGWVIVDDFELDGCRKAVHEIIGYPQPAYFQKVAG